MNIYLAASYERRLEILEYANLLEHDGHEIVSRWLNGEGEQHTDAWCALQDHDDLNHAHCQINFTDGKLSRGGRNVELGYAVSWQDRVLLVGPREHVFHHLPWIEHFDTFEEARKALRDDPSPVPPMFRGEAEMEDIMEEIYAREGVVPLD